MADPGNRHYFGLNRPEQTGEAESHGFRTSAHADAAPALPTLDPTGTGWNNVLSQILSARRGFPPKREQCKCNADADIKCQVGALKMKSRVQHDLSRRLDWFRR